MDVMGNIPPWRKCLDNGDNIPEAMKGENRGERGRAGEIQ